MKQTSPNKNLRGFTLLEILLVIAAIGILAAIVIVAINPQRQLAQVRNSARQSDVNTLHKALEQYLIDEGSYPVGLSEGLVNVCNTGGNAPGEGSINPGCLDLRSLVPTYLASIPIDPTGNSPETNYYIGLNPSNGKLSVTSALAESENIAINPYYSLDGLQFAFDMQHPLSYPGSGNTVYGVAGESSVISLASGASYDDDFGGSILFDGVDDYATFDTPFDSSENSHTVEVWFKGQSGTSANGGYGYILHNSTQSSIGSSYFTLGIDGAGGDQYFGSFNGSITSMRTGVVENTTNVYHLAITWDGQTQRVYMNGEETSEENLNSIANDLDTITSIGSTYRSNFYRPFAGQVYAMRIYDRGLSESDIQQHFDTEKSRFGIE